MPSPHPVSASLVASALRAWSATWRVYREPSRGWDALREPCVVGFWHGELLPLVLLHRDLGLSGLASWSSDGAWVAAVIERLGYASFRGSSSRGGIGAARTAQRIAESGGRPALALDGPRGPRHVPHLGAVGIARRAGVPLVLGTAASYPRIALGTWDALEVPVPGATVWLAYDAIAPEDLPEEAQEAKALIVARLDALSARVSTPR